MNKWIEWMDSVRNVVSGVVIPKRKDMLFDTLNEIYKDEKSEKKVGDVLIGNAYKDGRSATDAFSGFVKWLVSFFDYSHIDDGYTDYIRKECGENPIYGSLLYRWVRDVRQGKSVDWFGSVYEETFQGKGKADALGQFYTPMSVGKLVGEIIGVDDGDMVFSDCCCGSGRLLLSVKTDPKRFNYFIGEDIDVESVRMCALNLMINGKRGLVVCHDSLAWDRFITAYEVNESNSPFECGMYSVREITQEEAESKMLGRSNTTMLKERMVFRAIKEKSGEIDSDEPFYVYANEYEPRRVVSNPPFGMKLTEAEKKKIEERFANPLPSGFMVVEREKGKVEEGQYLLF